MPKARVNPFKTFRNCAWSGLARVQGWDGANLNQSTTTSVHVVVTGPDGTVTYNNGGLTLTIANVIFDALQTDAKWGEDTTGYNFTAIIPGSAFPTVDIYRVEFIFVGTESSVEEFCVTWEGPVLSRSDTPS